MDVRMPDGTILRGVPEGTPKAEILARYEGRPVEPPRKSIGGQLMDATKATALGIQDALTFGAADEISALFSTVTGIGGKFGDYTGNQARQDATNRQDMAKAPVSTLLGQIGGGVGMGMGAGAGLTGLRAVGQAGLEGAAYGFNAAGADDRLTGAAIGGAGGAAGGALAQGISRVLSPRTSQSVRNLMNEGVDVTPGQALGGAAQRVEDSMQSLPGVGDVIRSAKQRGINTFNRAAINRSLKPIGKQLPDDVVGYEAIAKAQDELSDAYKQLLPGLKVKADPQFIKGMKRVADEATQLPEGRMTQLSNIVQRQIGKRFGKSWQMSGEAMKEAESELGRMSREFMGSVDADQRALGRALSDVQEELRKAVERSNPGKRLELSKINTGYANLKRVERAAAQAKNGVFTPGQLQTATRVMDKTAGKRQSARGGALMQDLATAARDVLPSTVPDSGTAGRLLTTGALGAGGLGLLQVDDPKVQALGVLSLMSAGVYTKPGQRAAVMAIAKRPEVAKELAKIIEKGAGGAAIGGAVLALPSQP